MLNYFPEDQSKFPQNFCTLIAFQIEAEKTLLLPFFPIHDHIREDELFHVKSRFNKEIIYNP
jgi:hypothetical protein